MSKAEKQFRENCAARKAREADFQTNACDRTYVRFKQIMLRQIDYGWSTLHLEPEELGNCSSSYQECLRQQWGRSGMTAYLDARVKQDPDLGPKFSVSSSTFPFPTFYNLHLSESNQG